MEAISEGGMTLEELIKEAVYQAMDKYMAAHSNGEDCQLLTAEEVAGLLGYEDRASVYKLVREGKLKAVKLGDKTVRVAREEVRRFIQERTA
jgi:excisionase family DNA binding protein